MTRGKQKIKIDDRFGALVVVRRVTKTEASGGPGRSAMWLVKCDCGAERFAPARRLLIGKLKACGVNGHRWGKELWGIKPKREVTPTYRSWAQMKNRCFNSKADNWSRYGGRGITVCDRWRDSFENFLADMGERPSLDYSIDRKDNDGNYELGNCRWATDAEQRANQRRSVFVEVNGKKVLLNEYAKELGLKRGLIYGRLKMGWTLEDAVTIPMKRHKKT